MIIWSRKFGRIFSEDCAFAGQEVLAVRGAVGVDDLSLTWKEC